MTTINIGNVVFTNKSEAKAYFSAVLEAHELGQRVASPELHADLKGLLGLHPDGAAKVGVKTLFIEPGSLWENGYNESFNSKLRDEILNMEIFYTLKEAKVLIERWRLHYNTVRPHGSLGYRPPAPETILPTVDVPAYARQWLRPVHQLKPRQTLT